MSATGETQIGWQDYVAVALRRRWFFVIPCVTIVVVSLLVGFALPKIYRAETTLLIQDPKIMNPLMEGVAVSSPVEERMRVIQEELLGWTSLSRLARELNLDEHAKSAEAFERLVKRLQKDIVVLTKGADLISLTYKSPDPHLAQRLLNTVTNIYIRRNVEAQTAEAETAIRFIASEMEGYKKKLEDAERALREFKELYAMDMPVATQLNSQIIALEVQLAQLLVENTEEHPTVIQVKRQIEEFKRRRNEEVKRVIASAIAKSQNPEIYADLAKQLDASSDPAVSADPKIQSAREVYQAWVQRLDSHATPDQAAAALAVVPAAPTSTVTPASQPAATSTFVLPDSGLTTLTLAPRQEQELARLNRDYEIHRKTYEEMKKRLELAHITQRLGQSDEGTKFKVIEPARLPLRPVSPNLWLVFLGSLTIGICAGLCAAFGAEHLDQSFQSTDDVQEALAMPVLGSISRIITEDDLEARRRRIKGWISVRQQFNRLQTTVFHPVWTRVDRALLRWGL